MDERGSEIAALWRAARRLRREAGGGKAPPLFAFSDPVRTPDVETLAERLPRGAGLVYRAFGAADAEAVGRRLAAVATRRGLTLLVGADAQLAEAVGAAGVHLPERAWREAAALKGRRPEWLVTAAAHELATLRAMGGTPLDAVFVSPVFSSRSPSAGAPLGVARLRRWVRAARLPVYALGGVDGRTMGWLSGTGVSGVAAVGAFA